MELEQAIEMTEALNLDNEHGISTLGDYGDEIATLLLEALNESDWISIDDEMPEDEGWYLCHFSDGSIETYPIDDHYGEAMEFRSVTTTDGKVKVTHWQPLPAPPQLRNE